jgi:hypothetical protein
VLTLDRGLTLYLTIGQLNSMNEIGSCYSGTHRFIRLLRSQAKGNNRPEVPYLCPAGYTEYTYLITHDSGIEEHCRCEETRELAPVV